MSGPSQEQRPAAPPHHSIARWWMKHPQPGCVFVMDLGEPSCFACGRWDQRAPTYPSVTIPQAWAKSGLQRAHLRPFSLGGDNEPSNFVLLCSPCHEEAPDWHDPAEMLGWMVRRESFWQADVQQFERAWAAVRPGYPAPWELATDYDADSLFSSAKRTASTHGPKLSWSTVALMVAQSISPAECAGTG